jgi:peroxiredoxin
MKFLMLMLFSLSAFAVDTGAPAPDFKLEGVSGKSVSLSAFKGKIVVLEWLNHGCPFVRKHYDSQNMQTLQRKYTKVGVVWLSVISSAEGKQGFVTSDEGLTEKTKNQSVATDILLDPKGTVGQAYGAKTTPHMFVIGREGNIAYQGAIDNRPDTEQGSIKGAVNYVADALDALMVNKKVAVSSTKAYGCSVKY